MKYLLSIKRIYPEKISQIGLMVPMNPTKQTSSIFFLFHYIKKKVRDELLLIPYKHHHQPFILKESAFYMPFDWSDNKLYYF